ncbi:hypothetical protein NQ317_001616 [Molorchus minor]|uniref:E3 ubiquitin-protein ligase MARCHF6-like C-terminal domain-containing protein n=1 Tax=Molorchus minor TaxID=1323400 RepID=A0ABQ9JR08_9CUCU|nr:hypothetical protein NQ317_001616 [Molorchus minor]
MGPDWFLRAAIERAYRDGIRDMNLTFIFKELAAPVVVSFGLALSIPYYVIKFDYCHFTPVCRQNAKVSTDTSVKRVGFKLQPYLFYTSLKLHSRRITMATASKSDAPGQSVVMTKQDIFWDYRSRRRSDTERLYRDNEFAICYELIVIYPNH